MEITDNLRKVLVCFVESNAWPPIAEIQLQAMTVCLKLVSPGLECVTLLPLKTEAGNNEISRQKTIKNHKSSVLVSAIYNGWAEITRTMIDDRKKYNVNKGKRPISVN